MRLTGKLDYLEMPATGGTLDRLKAFYSAAFSWSFTDYGPTYSAFLEGLDGGFQADAGEAPAKPLPVLIPRTWKKSWAPSKMPAARSSGRSSRSPAAGGSISSIRPATKWPSGASRRHGLTAGDMSELLSAGTDGSVPRTAILGIELSVGSSYKAARNGHVPAAGA